MIFSFEPIGFFHSLAHVEKYSVSNQAANATQGTTGVIQLLQRKNYEQALEDLQSFSHIWIIFCFHKNNNWKPKVLPPRGSKKRGVFATRAPYRPNPIGISCVKLIDIQGLHLFIASHDLLHETPILDIKPYIPYADSFPSATQGWLEDVQDYKEHKIHFSELCRLQIEWLRSKQVDLLQDIYNRLERNPYPHPTHRIVAIDNERYELAYKSWRIEYLIQEKQVLILKIKSGYTTRSLLGGEPSRWSDIPLHREFNTYFHTSNSF